MSASFRALHRRGEPLLLPNAWDHASASAFAAAGFRAVGTTSLGVAATAGLLDGVGGAREETLALAVGLCGRPWMVSTDVEGGFSEDPAEVAELCMRLSEAGVVGVNLEDGRGDGSLRDAGHHAAIVAAVNRSVPELFVNARTDTAWLNVGDMQETLSRVAAYAEAGAAGVFVPGLTDPHDLELVVAATQVPVNALLTPGGLTVSDLAEVGVARVSCGSLLFRVALAAATDALQKATAGSDLTALASMTYDEVQALAH